MAERARAVTLSNYELVARHLGLDAHEMIARAGLKLSLIDDPEMWIPAGRVLDLLDRSALASERDDFGVLLGECRSFGSLGPITLLLRHEKGLREIIEAMIQYRRLLNELLHFTLHDHGEATVLEWSLVPGLHSSQGINLLATVAYRVLIDGSGCGFTPECIHFRQSRPDQVATFERVFRCPLDFDCSFDGVSFRTSWLDRPNVLAEPELAAHARRLLDLLPGIRAEETIVERVRSIIPMIISRGDIRIRDVADALAMPPRTLQRRLAAEGYSFEILLNECRRELAVRYLSQSSQSVTAVAQLTGYSALSSFTRWFLSEFGAAPASWRRTIRDRQRFARPLAVAS